MITRPARHGVLWDRQEEELLLIRFKRGLKPQKLSKLHERTIGGITSRLIRLCVVYNCNKKRALRYIDTGKIYCRWFKNGVEEQPEKKRKKKKKRQ
jgi:hypothetical protein